MIGVVGPQDSVAQVERVAATVGLASSIIPRSYRDAADAPRLARPLLALCSVILFSGRLPYRMALAAGLPPDLIDYIPHGGADLFRTLALIALRSDKVGHVPRFSFDTVTRSDVEEAYDELNLRDGYRIIPLEGDDPDKTIDIDRIVAAHRSMFSEGAVDCCATCIRGVFDQLSHANVHVIRIDHSRSSIRQALLKAKLRHDLTQAEASQTAVCFVSQRDSAASRPVARRVIAKAARELAALLDSHIIREVEDGSILVTTRNAIETRLKPELLSSGTRGDVRMTVGVGFGTSAEQAETLARQAQQRTIHFPERFVEAGDSAFIFETIDPERNREDRQADLGLAKELNISPVIVRRLATVFRTLDPRGFTATELAKSYSFAPRSARRLLKHLKERGFVEECGVRNNRRAGRPEAIYRMSQAYFSGLQASESRDL